ncbi:unnamed protein product, partial [Amoebophrya sp. A25]
VTYSQRGYETKFDLANEHGDLRVLQADMAKQSFVKDWVEQGSNRLFREKNSKKGGKGDNKGG